jgi:hypothetical protein
VVLLAGSNDEACEPWQSEDAARDLNAEGYNASFVGFDGADHFAEIYNDLLQSEVVARPDEPAGDRVVKSILDGIVPADS